MNTNKSNLWARVVCRPALLKDTSDMLELTRHIWEGNDYVPRLWSDWLADPEGFLAVAEYSGRVVGLSMLECFQAGEWYMAGLRVHPDMEGHGVASRLHDYTLDYWHRHHGQGVIRLATHNPRVMHLCERTRFHQVGEFTIFVASSIPEMVENFIPLLPDQIDQALAIAYSSPVFDWHARLYGHGWYWSDPQPKYILEAIDKGRAWLWQNEVGVLVIEEDDNDEGFVPLIALLGCPDEELSALLMDYRRLSAAQGYKQSGWIASLHPKLQPYLEAAGFHRDWDEALSVFELRIP